MDVTLLDLARPVAWTPWWAAVSFLVGLSVGGFALALPGRAFGVPDWQRASRLGLLVALAAGLAAPACMLAALARPERIGLLYSRPDGSSGLAAGAVLTPSYLAALAVFAWTTMRRDLGATTGGGWLARLHRVAALGGGGAPQLRMAAMIATGVLGFFLLRATAGELRPAWGSTGQPWHLAMTALAGALGAVLVLDRLAGGARDAGMTALLARATAGVLVIGMVLGGNSAASVGVIAEGIAALVALAWPARLGWLAGAAALAACWAVRWDLVAAGAFWPWNQALLAPLGTAGLLAALLASILALAPVLGPRREAERSNRASRRRVLLAGAAGAGLAAACVALRDTASRIARPAGAAPHALAPEARVDPRTGAVTPNPDQYVAHVACPTCSFRCGARLRVERATGRLLRITGNPFHPFAADPALPETATLRDAFAALSRRHEAGLAGRATLCARGALLLSEPDDARRLRTCMKRAGPRGSGQWSSIPVAQLVREVVEGGDLFGNGPVPGLRALRGVAQATPLGLLTGHDNGRTGPARDFLRAYGSGTLTVQQAPLPCPDLRDVAFLLIFGSTLPGQRLARQIAERRAAGHMVTVLTDAVLGPADNLAAGAQSRWLPVRPGSEAVLARAVIRLVLGRGGADDAATICGVPEAEVAALARDFAVYGQRAACVASGPSGAEAAAALNALAGHPGATLPPEPLPDGLKAVLLWGCDPDLPAAALEAPLVVAVSPALDETTRHADYVVPDTRAFESWGLHSGPGAGVTTAWPAVAPQGGGTPACMEGFLLACARAMDLPGFAAGTAEGWYIRAIAAAAEAGPAVPAITDDEVFLSGLERIRPLLEAELGEPAWRRAAFVLARGGRFPSGADGAPAMQRAETALAAPDGPPPASASASFPLLLAVRPNLRPGSTGPATEVALHAGDAAALGLRNGESVTVETSAGAYSGRLQLRRGVMRGVVAITADAGALHDGSPARLRRT